MMTILCLPSKCYELIKQNKLLVIYQGAVIRLRDTIACAGQVSSSKGVSANMRRNMYQTLLLAILILTCLGAQPVGITEKHLRFVDYPGFPEAHSTWGSIGYSSVHNKVFIGVTNHSDRVGLFEYDVISEKMRLCGFIPELAHLRDYQWQGKVHSQIVEGPGGAMYFATDGGESREEYLMEHPHGYSGGFFLKWDPATGTLSNLGIGMQYESIKDLAVDRASGRIYAVSYPQVHLLTYDTEKNQLRDLGRMGSDHVPRVMFSDWWGNVYYVDWRQRLIKYEPSAAQLLFAKESLPAFPGTPGEYIVTGVTAYAVDHPGGIIYLVTYGAKMLAFHPSREGIGKVEDLGGIFDGSSEPAWKYYCPNLALGANGKLYYFLGGHGMYAGQGENIVLMEFDPRNRQKRIALTFTLSVISEVTGSDVKDGNGNLYFAGRRSDPKAEQRGESGSSRPFLIIFNPGRPLQ
jgi:ribosomal protein L37E